MPFFEHLSSLELARNLKAFLRLEAGVTRGELPETGRTASQAGGGLELQQARRKILEQDRQLKDLRTRLEEWEGGGAKSGLRPENIVWVFSSGRSGTTWLRDMMKEMSGYSAWEEPRVGSLFGGFYGNSGPNQLKARNYIVAEPHRKTWINSIRNFVLDGARVRFPELSGTDHLVIKEPNGSEGAPLLMEALPESRMVFMVRDPRDVVSSTLDGAREGHWLYEKSQNSAWKKDLKADNDPDEFIKGPARRYLQKVSKAKEAYDAHKGRKVFVRYEELNADTLGTMRRIFSELELPVDEQELSRVVRKHSWDSIPEDRKGEGKFYRKASPGSWKEDLTPEQARTIEKITGPLLEEFYAG